MFFSSVNANSSVYNCFLSNSSDMMFIASEKSVQSFVLSNTPYPAADFYT